MANRRRRFRNKQKVKGGVLKRTQRRARELGTLDEIKKGGITGREARQTKQQFKRKRGGDDQSKPKNGAVGGGIRKRAEERLGYLEEHGGLEGLTGIRKGGITRPEARRIRRAWNVERTHNPLEPRSGRDLLREAESLTDLEFAPQEAEVGRARQYETGRQNVLYGPGGWFGQYQADVGAIAQRQMAAEQGFQAGIQAAGANAMQQNVDAQMQMMQQSAATGQAGGTQPNPELAQMAAQAAAGQHQANQAFQTAMGQTGSANVAFMNTLGVAAGQQGQEGLMNSQARVAKIDALAKELAIDRGNAKTKYLAEGREAERTYDLSRSAFGLDVAEAQEDARHNRQNERENRLARRAARRENDRDYRRWKREFGAERADEMYARMEKDRRFKLDREKFGFDKAKERWKRRHPNFGKSGSSQSVKGDTDGDGVADRGKYKGYSETERDKFDTAMRKLRAIERKEYKTDNGKVGGPGYVRKNRELMIDSLVEKGIPPRIARRAVQRFLRKSGRARNNSVAEAIDNITDLGLN